MKSLALVAVSLVFVLQTAPSRAEEWFHICSDGRTILQQCEDRDAVILREYRSDELIRADYLCRRFPYPEVQPYAVEFAACMEATRLFSEMGFRYEECYRAVECEPE
jgi:hypothetical protein